MRGKQDHSRERALRRNQTQAEHILWQHLRNGRLFDHKFRRQHRIGPYYADFYCAKALLVIELDGSQHLDNPGYDKSRTRFLESRGCRIIRFWNDEAMAKLESVLEVIALALITPHPPSPQPPGGGIDPLPASGARDEVWNR